MPNEKNKKSKLFIIAVIALIALYLFTKTEQKTEPKELPPSTKVTAPPLPGEQAKDSEPTDVKNIQKNNAETSQLPQETHTASSNATVGENGNVAAPNANNFPPDLPDDLREQLLHPPSTLPPDLEAQLNSPPPEIPEDIKRALQTPPRTVTLDEVNNPNWEKEHGPNN